MQTAAISYRVADFLKQHPPFIGIEEADLLTLVSRGRVKFHESDEFLCWQRSSYSPFLFVIQQGSVSLWEEADGTETLHDIRGPGDMLGIERYLGEPSYPYSAKANEDVVIYALQAADFEPLLDKYPQAARYIDAYATAGAVYRDPGRHGVHERFVVELARHPEPLSCPPGATVMEAARIMRSANADSIAVMRAEELQGVVTTSDIVAWAAEGGPASRSVNEIMGGVPPAVAPQTLVSDCVLALSRATSGGVLALTADGTSHGGLLRLISAADLQPAFGDNPLAILKDIANATDIEVLRVLHLRARAFLFAPPTEPSTIDWLAAFGDRLNISVVKRLIELAGNASEKWSWCFWGAAGRRELVTPVEPGLALLCDDAADVSRGRQALERLRADLAECGYLPGAGLEAGDEILCATAGEWQERLARWIHDPILSEMYSARPLFDLRPAVGSPDSWQHLEKSVSEAMRSHPTFQKLLAHDCLAALPPLTFFQDQVVDEGGERTEVFELEHRALGPIVEMGRALGIANQCILGSSTIERLELARSRVPAHDRIFREASETLRVLLYLQARTGLRLHDRGTEILPSQLSRLDRQALKSGFRAIHNLLEFTIKHLLAEAP